MILGCRERSSSIEGGTLPIHRRGAASIRATRRSGSSRSSRGRSWSLACPSASTVTRCSGFPGYSRSIVCSARPFRLTATMPSSRSRTACRSPSREAFSVRCLPPHWAEYPRGHTDTLSLSIPMHSLLRQQLWAMSATGCVATWSPNKGIGRCTCPDNASTLVARRASVGACDIPRRRSIAERDGLPNALVGAPTFAVGAPIAAVDYFFRRSPRDRRRLQMTISRLPAAEASPPRTSQTMMQSAPPQGRAHQ